MSEESLRLFLEQLSGDAAFVERVKANPAEALGEFDLSPAERVALTSNDEDGLRRLAGLDDVSGFLGVVNFTEILCPPTSYRCTMADGCSYFCPTSDCRK